MTRILDIGTKRFTKIEVTDEPGPGGACHTYEVNPVKVPVPGRMERLCIGFQKGPVGEVGLNGIFMEDLNAICVDRLQAFQSGDYACEENQNALDSLQMALKYLNQRTEDRIHRGVEGKNEL